MEHVTTEPPPFAESLHWLTVTANCADCVGPVATVHVTLVGAPPPFTEPLHWVIVAPVVVAGEGSQLSVGAVPPP